MAASNVSVASACLWGVEALPIQVEVATSAGLPGISIVGLPGAGVMDARSRVRCALKSCGFKMPPLHYTVNLAPAGIRKNGTGFDLPIAVAVLALSGQMSTEGLDRCLFVGELGLAGEVCETRGTVAYQMLARRLGVRLVGAGGATLGADGCDLRPLRSLADLRRGVKELPRASRPAPGLAPSGDGRVKGLDFVDVYGQEEAKRALVIAAAGKHGLLMVGSPGAGKTMLARRLPSILPPLTDAELEEVLLMSSVSGQPVDDMAVFRRRPFRAPHHSVSLGGLVGGGRPVIPGEISLAHHGVLFLDELPEFATNVLQALRQPMEDRCVRLVRVDGLYSFPCDFQLVAAANPCPCGHLGDPARSCSCAPGRVQAYQGRIGGPLMDRIDLHLDVRRPPSQLVVKGVRGMGSAQMRELVMGARERRARRARRSVGAAAPLAERLLMEGSAQSCLEGLAARLALGGRTIVKIARVARTIADVEGSDKVLRDHVLEASGYRSRAGEREGHV